ncbi:hypothetical protein [Kitasatospora viridis]|uniref:Secreted protein n=1 Tax=Kitasatospora viridis TaxID=281105 RepID=A0A561UQD5_9ACTN|nr:hypothetical protein [Kitasatospora viridis]TWG01561.1 hypothetical protein FHX73_115462 [Kitasatospora viridis]
MSRSLLLALGATGLALAAAAPVQAADVRPADVQPVTTCGAWALQAGLGTQVCATVTGNTVSFAGTVGLAGPPSPGTQLQPQQLDTALTAQLADGTSLDGLHQGVLFRAANVQVGPLTVTAPCGSTVHASFAVNAYPWVGAPVGVDVSISC